MKATRRKNFIFILCIVLGVANFILFALPFVNESPTALHSNAYDYYSYNGYELWYLNTVGNDFSEFSCVFLEFALLAVALFLTVYGVLGLYKNVPLRFASWAIYGYALLSILLPIFAEYHFSLTPLYFDAYYELTVGAYLLPIVALFSAIALLVFQLLNRKRKSNAPQPPCPKQREDGAEGENCVD